MDYRDDIRKILTRCNMRAGSANTSRIFKLLEAGEVNDELLNQVRRDLTEKWEAFLPVEMGQDGWAFLQAQVIRFYELFKACPVFCPTIEQIPADPYLIMLPQIDDDTPPRGEVKKLLWRGYRIIHLLDA